MSLSAKPSLLGVIQNVIRISSSRSLSVSTPRSYREVTVKEDGKKITIEGIPKESERKGRLIEPDFLKRSSDSCEVKDNCHSLCKFSQVHEIKHTDVLILEQFVESNGKIIPRDVTGLCERQHYRLDKLIGMAQKAGLMGSKDKFAMEKTTKPWAKNNCYWDEKTIDTQWLNLQNKKKRSKFRSLSNIR